MLALMWWAVSTLQESRGGGDFLISDLELVGYKHQIENVDKPVAIHVRLGLVRAKALSNQCQIKNIHHTVAVDIRGVFGLEVHFTV